MLTLPLILLLFLVVWKFKSIFQKYSIVLYVSFTIISIVSVFFINVSIFLPFKMGYLGLAFIYVVMLVGALPKKSKQTKENPIRRDYSILGFITITPHALYYILQNASGEQNPIIFGVIAYVVMIPLFITSFRTVRHKMKESNWKKLQKLAYVVYISLFIHLIMNSSGINLILYVVLFSFYFVLKILDIYKKTRVKISFNQELPS
ncbi:MAG: ferric reductase-like transmembrane domain-containing protein [Acholeplasmataceae bacterium]|nr:ferric reductase-like transmembrane domain-containing protein [Acholeplasmataceae bacterium]